MTDQRWIFKELLELARFDAAQAEQIKELQKDRERRSLFLPNLWQMLSALASIAALLIAIFKK